MLSQLKSSIQGFLSIEFAQVSHVERFLSTAGGFAGIFGILLVSQHFLDAAVVPWIVASMGASAVLLFAVPHGPLSQPWALLGGHLVSAIIGVSVAILLADWSWVVAASLAVGLAIGAMHYLRCIHPPGGATAIFAVIGGQSVQGLGYQYVLTPVMLNALVILVVAVAFNYLFAWRRYPAWIKAQPKPVGESYEAISHGDLVYALSEIDSFVDINEQDLLRIYSLATSRALSKHLEPSEIMLWHYYSNGEEGDSWSIRRIVDESTAGADDTDTVIYKVMDGHGYRSTAYLPRGVFAQWARYEVKYEGGQWQRVSPDTKQASM